MNKNEQVSLSWRYGYKEDIETEKNSVIQPKGIA